MSLKSLSPLGMGLLLVLLVSASPVSAQSVTLKKVKYDELTKIVRDHKGKVVLVDFWATYCVPCKKGFPELVKMHKEYASQGFVAISVSVDDPEDEDAAKEAMKFLQEEKADFTNLLLDEETSVWQKKLHIKGVPCIYIFNREGKIAQKFLDATKKKEMEALVKRLLKQ